MRFHVLGVGAIGSLFANHLRRALVPTHPISLILKNTRYVFKMLNSGRSIRVERDGIPISASGFRIEDFERSYSLPHRGGIASNPDAGTNPDMSDTDKIESLFVITKAHGTVPAITRLLPRLSRNCTIVLLQNGMGIYEELIEQVFRNPLQRPHFILATNTHGAFLKGMFDVVHTGVGELKFAIMPDGEGRAFERGLQEESIPRLERRPRLSDITTLDDPRFIRYRTLRNTVAALLLLEPLQTSWLSMAELQILMRRKLAVNAIVNPLTAVMDCRNGEIFTSKAASNILRDVCEEISRLYAAEFLADAEAYINQLENAGMDPDEVLLNRVPRQLTSHYLQTEVLRVVELTKGNYSSMLSDIRRNNQTEIQYINGFLLRQAAKYKIHMPVTKTLTHLVYMRSAIPIDHIVQ